MIVAVGVTWRSMIASIATRSWLNPLMAAVFLVQNGWLIHMSSVDKPHPLLKTTWCDFRWRSHGCRWGDRCYHAHSIAEYKWWQWYKQKCYEAGGRWQCDPRPDRAADSLQVADDPRPHAALPTPAEVDAFLAAPNDRAADPPMMQVLNRQQMLMYLLQRRMIGQLLLHRWHSYPLFFQVLPKEGRHHKQQRRVRNVHKRRAT